MIAFPPLDRLPWLIHGFTLRPDGGEIILKSQGIEWSDLRLAEQVHGNQVAMVSADNLKSLPATRQAGEISNLKFPIPGADGLVTATANVPLGIYVADCCAVFLVEPRKRAIALLHSGRRGTEENIVHQGMESLMSLNGGNPSDVVAVLSPCIHRCCYEVDFVAQIEQQLRNEGVREIWRHPDCTSCRADLYYSYRKEKGRTGRMLAFAMVTAQVV